MCSLDCRWLLWISLYCLSNRVGRQGSRNGSSLISGEGGPERGDLARPQHRGVAGGGGSIMHDRSLGGAAGQSYPRVPIQEIGEMNHKTRHPGNPARTIAFCVVILILVTKGVADVELPAVISDNMVLQQGMNVPIWGWAEPGEKVSVKGGWQDSSVSTKADKNGKWTIKLRTPKPGGPFEITIKGENTITLANVLVGEVWVCSGQSNMAMPVKRAADAAKEIATAGYPRIRLFAVERHGASERPRRDCRGRWLLCSPKTIPSFSAVGYFYGRELHTKLKMPIGLIDSSWGSTSAEAWMSRRTLEADPVYEPIVKRLSLLKKTCGRMTVGAVFQVYDTEPLRGIHTSESRRPFSWPVSLCCSNPPPRHSKTPSSHETSSTRAHDDDAASLPFGTGQPTADACTLR